MKRFPILFALLFLACANLRAVNPAATLAPDPLRDLARLRRDSNPARLQVLREILRERGIPHELQTFESKRSPLGRIEGTNVVITFGSGPREITVGAHYDAVERKEGGLIDGMVDNGAGVMALLEVAEALKGKPLRHRVRIVFFDKEEVDLGGSKAYVAAHKGEIAAAVNLDIAGFGDTGVFGLGKTAGDARLRQSLQAVCAAEPLSCLELPVFPNGDDRSFQAAGLPAISIGFLPRIEAHQLWLFLNGGKDSGLREEYVPPILRIIHTPEDTLDRIDPETPRLAARVVLEMVLRLDGELPPG